MEKVTNLMSEEKNLQQQSSIKQDLPSQEQQTTQNDLKISPFIYKNKEYLIDSSKKIPTYGDFNESTNIIYVDKSSPNKFHEGIAVHEIEELEMLKKGHSYVYSHNYAQKKELVFYQSKYGNEEGIKILIEEENLVLNYKAPNLRISRIKSFKNKNIPAIEIELIRRAIYKNKKYKIDSSLKLIHSLSDLYETKNIIYIDKDIPERFYEGLVIYEIELRNILKQGLGYLKAREEANKKELEFYQSKYGNEEGIKIIKEENELQEQMFVKEIETLPKENGHKIIYEKHEILPA